MDLKLSSKDKRTGVACEECRRRKRKCDGKRPKCTLCTTLEKECTYAGATETRKRKQFSGEYVTDLEEQVASLKAYIQDLERSGFDHNDVTQVRQGLLLRGTSSQEENLGDASINEHVTDDFHEDTEAVLTSDSSPVNEKGLLTSAIDEVGSLIWKMNIGGGGEPAFTGPSGNFCFPSSLPETADRNGPRKLAREDLGLSFHSCSLDTRTKRRLADLFMTQINPLHQFLQPSTTLSPEMYPITDEGLDLLHSAVFAAGACFSDQESEKTAGRAFARHAENNALKCCRDQQSTVVVEALSILAWVELSQENVNMAWIYISMAAGLAMSIGLHVLGLQALSDPGNSMIHEQKEVRVRTFWAFFLMDRMATSILGRNCTIPWRRVDVPTFDTILGSAATIDEKAFDQQCKLWFLHDQFMDQIYAFDFTALGFSQRNGLLLAARESLLTFRRAIPTSLHIPTTTMLSTESSPPRSALFFQMSYQMSLLLIHRPYLRESTESTSFRLALTTMTVAASNMTRYIQLFQKHYSVQQSQPPAPPFVIHHILTACIMHLLDGTSNDHRHKRIAKRKLQVCMEALDGLQTSWKGASKAITQIQDLAQRWRVVGILPMRFSMPFLGKPRVELEDSELGPHVDSVMEQQNLATLATSGYFLQNTPNLPMSVEENDTSLLNYDLDSIFHDYTGVGSLIDPVAAGNYNQIAQAGNMNPFDFDLFALQDLSSLDTFTGYTDPQYYQDG